MKYYAVKKGQKTGIYTNWIDCKKQTDKYPGAVFKAFNSKNEALIFLKKVPKAFKVLKNSDFTLTSSYAIAYSDGSFNKSNCTYSYGAIILWNSKEFHFSKRYADMNLQSMWNISGELEGAKRVMLFAFVNNIDKLILYHDYKGIAEWANNKWKTNNDEAKDYIKFVNKIKTKVNLEFQWVKGHSNNYYNDLADKLASQATFNEYLKKI